MNEQANKQIKCVFVALLPSPPSPRKVCAWAAARGGRRKKIAHIKTPNRGRRVQPRDNDMNSDCSSSLECKKRQSKGGGGEERSMWLGLTRGSPGQRCHIRVSKVSLRAQKR